MEVSVQLHAPAALPDPRTVWTQWRREIQLLPPSGLETRSSSPYPSL